jgi:hypothetical protein
VANDKDCYTFECDPATGKLTRQNCPGMCRPANYYLTSARFANSKSAIIVGLSAPALLGTLPCARVFDAASMARLGGSAMCTVAGTNDASNLEIALGTDATVVLQGTLRLSPATALVSISDPGRRFSGGVTVTLCSSCEKPLPVVVGPATVAPPCDAGSSDGAAAELRFDGRSSRDPSGRPLKDAIWNFLGGEGLGGEQGQAIFDAVEAANKRATVR